MMANYNQVWMCGEREREREREREGGVVAQCLGPSASRKKKGV
jgi:hypothetical protein